MKKWILWVEQNGGEYKGEVFITAKEITQKSATIVIADGIEIDFDEIVLSIELA